MPGLVYLLALGFALVLLALSAALAIGWRFSSRLLAVEAPEFLPEFEIIGVAEDGVVLPRKERTEQRGRYGLRWERGSGLLGDILREDAHTLTRRFCLLDGEAPRGGEGAQLDVYLYRGDPQTSLGLAFATLTLAGEAGSLQAWWLAGGATAGETAVVMLHGRGATRHESLRTLPAVLASGCSALLLAYRNHDGSVRSPDGFHHYGFSEWRDVVTAVDTLAAEHGVQRVILYGFSMGGAVALEAARALTRREREAGRAPQALLAGLILDAPLLDVHATIEAAARRRGLALPGPLTRLALAVARLRTGIDWRALDKRRTLHELAVPILLIHGDADSVTPVGVSDTFAALAPRQVRYHRVAGAGHVEAWNQDPAHYEGWLGAFLREVAGP